MPPLPTGARTEKWKYGLCSTEQNNKERIWKKCCDAKRLFCEMKDRISEEALWLDLFKYVLAFLNTPCGYITVTFILCCIMPKILCIDLQM